MMNEGQISLSPDGRNILVAIPFNEDVLRDHLGKTTGYGYSMRHAIDTAIREAMGSSEVKAALKEAVGRHITEYLSKVDLSQAVRATAEKQARRILASEVASVITRPQEDDDGA